MQKLPKVFQRSGLLFLFLAILLNQNISAQEIQSESSFKLRFDEKLNYYYTRNIIDLDKQKSKPRNYMRFTTRLEAGFSPKALKDFSFTCRLVNQTESQFHPQSSWDVDEVIFDKFYFDLDPFIDKRFSLRVGRQYLIYGDGFVIFDGTPGDSVRTGYFNAVKGSFDLGESRLDSFFVYQPHKDKFLVLNDRDQPLNNPRTSPTVLAGGLYFINQSLDGHQIDGYYIYKREYNTSQKMNLHTLGVRPSGKIGNNWSYKLEPALQLGRYGPQNNLIRAFGSDNYISYTFPVRFSPRVRLGHTYLSGNRPGTNKFEGWDPVLMGWSKWSELYTVTLIREGGANHWTNLNMPRVELEADLTKNQSLLFGYHYLRANTKPYSQISGFGQGKERGHLFKGVYRFKLNQYTSGHLWVEWFRPGNYYTPEADPALFFRSQLFFEF